MIPHNSPSWGEAEAKAAYDVVLSGRLAAGERVLAVEQEWARLTRSEDAAMVSSGVSALRLALIALGIGPGDEVIIPAYSCVALHNSVLSVGAKYVLADIYPDSLTIDWSSVVEKITDRTKAVIAVHLFGAKAKLPNIGVPVVEDMAHGIFEQQGGLAISSFSPTKLIGSCYGGIVSGKKSLIDKVRDWRDYGDKPPSLRQNDLPNEISAAIALQQLKNIQETQALRTGPAIDCDHIIQEWAVSVELCQRDNPWSYRYAVKVNNAARVSEAMKAKGICAEQPVWDYRKRLPWNNQVVPDDWAHLPNTNIAFDQVLSLPIYAGITFAEQEQVVKVLGEVLRGDT